MVSMVVDRLRLILGGLALVGAQTAAAGLMLTADSIEDFRFDGSEVVYDPPYHRYSVSPTGNASRSDAREDGTSPPFPGATRIPIGDLYLTATERGVDALFSGEFQVSRKLSPNKDTQVLLEESLRQIQSGGSPGDFDFLVKQDGVDGSLATQYRRSGLPVPVRVADPGSAGLTNAYGDLAGSIVLDQPGRQTSSRGVPVPGTLLLLLAGLSLAAFRRRR